MKIVAKMVAIAAPEPVELSVFHQTEMIKDDWPEAKALIYSSTSFVCPDVGRIGGILGGGWCRVILPSICQWKSALVVMIAKDNCLTNVDMQ